MAMYIKKKIEARKHSRIVAMCTNNNGTDRIRISPNCMNNQRLNQYVCTTAGMLLLLLTIFIIWLFDNMILFYNFILEHFRLNRDEKMLLTQDFVEISLNLCIPLYMYWKNDALFDHLAHEILNIPQPHSL